MNTIFNRIKITITALVFFIFASTISTFASAQQMNSGWYWPTGSSNFCGYLGWLDYNNANYPWHLGVDMCNTSGNPIYAIGDGTIVLSRTDVGGYGRGFTAGGALVARHQASDGTWFTAVYGHIDYPHSTGSVTAGEIIGYSNNWNPGHLHFGVHPGYDLEPTNPWRGYSSSQSNTYGFVDPIPFLNSHPIQVNRGRASVSSLQVPSSVVLGQNFNITVSLKEVNGASITFDTVALKIRKSDGTDAFDFKNFGSITIPANGTWTQTVSGQLFATSWPAGTYKAVVRGNVNGSSFDFGTTGSGVNPASFTAAAAATSEIDTLLNASHETSWAYFQDATLSKWFISNSSGVTYGLGQNSNKHAAWISIGSEAKVASIDFPNKRVSVIGNTSTSSTVYKATSLVGGEGSEFMYSAQASNWAKLIEGATLPAKWYFFRVDSTQTWYIIEIHGTSSSILRLNLTQDKSNYDWKSPLDGSSNAIDTSTWKKNFYLSSSGKWMVSFSK